MGSNLKELVINNKKIIYDDSSTGNDLKPGDAYIAHGNFGWELLHCRYVNERCWVIPSEGAYYFDTLRCRKVVTVEEM